MPKPLIPKWEYKVAQKSEYYDKDAPTRALMMTTLLNYEGSDGWRLVPIQLDDLFVFERQLVEQR